ncbi:hypothetical protein KP509_02G082600 [Ceratopteris richardii]|nr:hypothetical protein KP509_02G082600 [Ceratopteris richardii]
MFWTMKHLPPAHIFLITGDNDFSVLVHKLRLLGYTILISAPCTQSISAPILHAASKIWVWPDILMGDPAGLMAETHIPGTPLPDLHGIRKKDGESKQTLTSFEDVQHDVERAASAEVLRKVKTPDMGCVPAKVVDTVVNIVKEHPGITLGELEKNLRLAKINPRSYGYPHFFYFLSRMGELEMQQIAGTNTKDRVIFNVSSCITNKGPAVLSYREGSALRSQHDGLLDSSEYMDKHNVRAKDDKVQKKRIVSNTLGFWGSQLLKFLKGRG